jgi:hypothetical protein
MSRAAKIALFAGVLALITLAGGASLIVSQTKVDPDAIRSSVTRSEAGVEKAWMLPAASTFKRGTDVAVKPLVVRPRQYRERAEILGRNGNFRKRGSSRDGSLLDRRLFYGVDARRTWGSHTFEDKSYR